MSTTDQLLDTAFTAYNAADYDRAEELAREVLAVEPGHGDALYLLGLIAFQANALEPAAEILYGAVKLYPNVESYALALASVLHRQKHYDEALSFYEKYKNQPHVLSQMGIIYAQKGQNEWAKSAFNEALKLNQADSAALIGLAQLAQKEGDAAGAEKYLRDAQRLCPCADVYHRLAISAREANRLDEAIDFIQKALQSEQKAVYLNEYGLILEQSGDLDGALEKYIEASRLNAYYADAYANQGNIYLKKNDKVAAEDAYKRALANDRNFLAVHHNLAVLLFEQGRKAESLGHYQEAVIINPKHVPSIYNLAMILEDMGDYSEAAGLYFNALVLGLKTKELDLRIAATLTGLYKMGKDAQKQALEFAKGWVKNFPDNPVAKHTLAAFGGKKDSQAAAYAKELFDAFAPTYETTMQKLQSKAVSTVVEMLGDKSYKTVLDLACGTGLFATAFKGHYNSIVGVDISEEMLKKAAETKLYKKLINEPVETFLASNKQKFELIVAIEMIGYLDNPSVLFQGVRNHLTKNGHFALTVETAEKHNELSASGRYLYTADYIEKQLQSNGLKILSRQSIDLRKEDTGSAKGEIILAALA